MSAVALGIFVGATLGGPALTANAVDAPAPRPYVSGWLYQWSIPPADFVSAEHAGVTPEVNVIWGFFGSSSQPLCTYNSFDLSCVTTSASNSTLRAIRDSLHSSGIRVFATIADVGGYEESQRDSSGRVLPRYQLANYIATPERREAYAERIVNWAVEAGVDGVDLDWEKFAWSDGSSTWAATRSKWIEMIKLLSEKLHAKNLLLSVTVPGESPEFQTPGVMGLMDLYAWADIAPYVDRLPLMVYDYHYAGGTPGAIGPQDWADRVIALAVSQVGDANRTKVMLGVAQYGYDWWARTGDLSDPYVTNAGCPVGWVPNDKRSRGLSPDRAVELAAAKRATVANGRLRWDETAKEWTFYYLQSGVPGSYPTNVNGVTKFVAATCNAKREVWYSDTRSAAARSTLVDKYQIGGIAVWNLTDIQDDFYAELGAYGRTIAQQPTTVAVTTPKVSRYGRTITVTAQASSSAQVPAGSVATLYWGPTIDACCTKVAEGITDSTGKVSFTTTVQREGYWWVRVAGSWWRLPGINDGTLTRARFAVTASATNLAPKVGQDVRIFTLVQPATKGAKVIMQKRVKGEWVNVHVLMQSTGGGASAHFIPRVARDIQFRFIATSANSYLRTVSPVVTLAVHR